jgi:diketogulonate reductase-like aldo/keto reductase
VSGKNKAAQFGSGAFPPDSSGAATALTEIAHNHAATPRQVALAFLARIPGLFLIPKASLPAHALDNAAAADLALTPQEITTLDEICPLGPDDGDLPTI